MVVAMVVVRGRGTDDSEKEIFLFIQNPVIAGGHTVGHSAELMPAIKSSQDSKSLDVKRI